DDSCKDDSCYIMLENCDKENDEDEGDDEKRFSFKPNEDLERDCISYSEEDNPLFLGDIIDTFPFGGLNKIFALYSYSRYVENSIYTDTGSGFVRKDHSNSFPV